MAKKVKIFNLNTHPLNEYFKGEEIHIDPQDYWRDKKGNVRVFDIFEAADFKGQYKPVPFDGSGKMLNEAKYYKMLRIDPIDEEADSTEEETPQFKCMAKQCKFVGTNEKELSGHIKREHPTAETLVLPDEDAAIRKRQKKAEVEATQKEAS